MSKKQRPSKVGKMLNGGPMFIKHIMYLYILRYVLITVLVLMYGLYKYVLNDIFSTYHLEENPGRFDAILFLVADLH